MEYELSIDFITYLKNELDLRIKKNSSYSLRAFSRDLNMPSSRLSELLNKKSGASVNTVKKIVDLLKLDKIQSEYLLNLGIIQFSSKKILREAAFKKISELKTNEIMTIQSKDVEYLDDWKIFAIAHAIYTMDIRIDCLDLSEILDIDIQNCKQITKKFIDNNLIKIEKDLFKVTTNPFTIIGKLKKLPQQFFEQQLHSYINNPSTDHLHHIFYYILDEEEFSYVKKIIGEVDKEIENYLQLNRKLKNKKLTKHNSKLYAFGQHISPIKKRKIL